MSIMSKIMCSRADAPNAWCIRPVDDGGLKLTFSKIVTLSDVTDPKKSFKKIAPTSLVSRPMPLYRSVSQGIEIQITNWSIYRDVLYVSDDTKVYKLLMTKSHGARMDTYQSVTTRLGRSTKIRRVFIE